LDIVVLIAALPSVGLQDPSGRAKSIKYLFYVVKAVKYHIVISVGHAGISSTHFGPTAATTASIRSPYTQYASLFCLVLTTLGTKCLLPYYPRDPLVRNIIY